MEGEGLRRLMERLDLDNAETVEYLQRLFDKIGLYKKLRAMQAQTARPCGWKDWNSSIRNKV